MTPTVECLNRHVMIEARQYQCDDCAVFFPVAVPG